MSFKLPSEALMLGVPSYNPDLGLDGKPGKQVDTNILLEEARTKVRVYGYDFDRPSKSVNSISAEVGDDEIDVSDNIAYTGLVNVFQRRLGMKESAEDTSISDRYGNFAEDLVILPDSYYQTYHHARNSSAFRDMSYIDICKIRLAIDIRPMRMNHSATNDGKASMIGKRQAWIPPGRSRARFDVFSLFQDIHLGLMRDEKFAYLPESLGGYGKLLPFNEKSNMERCIGAFRQGSHGRLIRSVVRRVNTWYDKFRRGENPDPDAVLAFISRYQSGWHDWIKGHSLYAPVSWIDVPPEIAEFRVPLSTRNPFERDLISRLLAEDILVPESKIQIVYEHNQLCESLLEQENVQSVKDRIESKRKEWRSNASIFSLEAYGYIKELTVFNEGVKTLADIEVLAFNKVIADQSLFNLKVQLRDEPVYYRKAIDTIYERGPMKVRFNIYPKFKGYTLFASQDYRSMVIDTEELNHIEKLEAFLLGGCVGLPPRRMLNDDETIIKEMSEDQTRNYYCIVTSDKRLCRLANRRTGKPVFRVEPDWYYRSVYFGACDEPWIKYLNSHTGKTWWTIEDTGSLVSFEENYFFNGCMLKKVARQRFSLLKSKRHEVPIDVEESENFGDEPPDARPETFLYDYRNELRILRSKSRS